MVIVVANWTGFFFTGSFSIDRLIIYGDSVLEFVFSRFSQKESKTVTTRNMIEIICG